MSNINSFQLEQNESYAVIDWKAENLNASNAEELEKAVAENKMAAMIGVEGGHMIENSLEKLEDLANRGMIYLTLTWNNSTPWSSSAAEETSGKVKPQNAGLNDFGKSVIHKLNELGVMVDLSHVGVKTFFDAINESKKPILVSHSCVYQLNPVPRNLNDEQIKAVGKNLSAGAAKVIDATGKHVTTGIIDEHSHIATEQGVNEGSHANTAEVHLGDVINPDDINIYRALAGGVTAVQVLHGSANPIGGRAQIISLRWGADAEGMKKKLEEAGAKVEVK